MASPYVWSTSSPGDTDIVAVYPALARARQSTLGAASATGGVLGTLIPTTGGGTPTAGWRVAQDFDDVWLAFNAWYNGTVWAQDNAAKQSFSKHYDTVNNLLEFLRMRAGQTTWEKMLQVKPPTGAVVNYLQLLPSITGVDPTLTVAGDANRGLLIQPVGTGSIAVGTPSPATNAVGGFAYIPATAGVPSGVPTGITGYAPIEVDSTNSNFYFYSGGWRVVGVPTGSIILYGSATPPTGYLACDGAAVSRATYAALFAVTSTAFGVGDGSTTFNLPDLRSRVPVGAGQGAGLSNRVLGTNGGEENHVLTIAEMPSHTHVENTVPAGSATVEVVAEAKSDQSAISSTTSTGATGGGGSHNTMQPWQAIQYCIKT